MTPMQDGIDPPESPFHAHLHTNYVPTDAEIDSIRAHLLPCEAELGRLEALIHELSCKRDRLQVYVDSHKALISQPRRVPQDVIQQIFIACLPTRHNAVMNVAEPPLLLGRICSGWRSVAFALPILWASIHIAVDFIDSEEKEVAVVDWLSRASPFPMAISVECGRASGRDDLIDILIPFSSRWSSLDLRNAYATQKHDFHRLAAVEAPMLMDITVAFGDCFTEEEGPDVLSSKIFRGKLLKKIAIASTNPFTLISRHKSCTWDYITDLVLEYLPLSLRQVPVGHYLSDPMVPQDARILLKNCPHLKCLKFPLISSYSDEFPKLLTIACLEALVIESHAPTSVLVGAFLDSIVLPRLTKFHIISRRDNALEGVGTAFTAAIERFRERSPLLSDVHLDRLDFSRAFHFVRGLQKCSSLQKLALVLWTPPVSDERRWCNTSDIDEARLFSILAPNAEDFGWPALEQLSVETQTFDEGTWMTLLHAHLNLRTNLRRFDLHIWHRSTTGSAIEVPAPDLAEVTSAGLDVSVKQSTLILKRATSWEGIQP
ncbi:hypothetical protein R3P38DRAFT_3284283 [Favolaschia claudopus]|uniref:F-box domain-containing protein n=1 Tax=Favolaschia claudopus TaxID=2862362 RepID=A0AAW0A5K1_9AGAR